MTNDTEADLARLRKAVEDVLASLDNIAPGGNHYKAMGFEVQFVKSVIDGSRMRLREAIDKQRRTIKETA